MALCKSQKNGKGKNSQEQWGDSPLPSTRCKLVEWSTENETRLYWASWLWGSQNTGSSYCTRLLVCFISSTSTMGKANSLHINGSILFSNYKDHQGNLCTYTITSVVLRRHNIVYKFRTFFLGTRKLLTPIMMATYQTNRTSRSTIKYSYYNTVLICFIMATGKEIKVTMSFHFIHLCHIFQMEHSQWLQDRIDKVFSLFIFLFPMTTNLHFCETA